MLLLAVQSTLREKGFPVNNRATERRGGRRSMEVIAQYLGQWDDTFKGRGGLLVLRGQPFTVATPGRQDTIQLHSGPSHQITCQPGESVEMSFMNQYLT